MLMRSLRPKHVKHLMGFPHTDIRALIETLYGIEEGIYRGLWCDSSRSGSKRKRPLGGHRSAVVGTINTTRTRPFK